MTPRTLWVLTEERPKKDVLRYILKKFFTDQRLSATIESLRIIPILDASNLFTSTYKVIGATKSQIENIFLKIVSGNSSFVDYLIFFQDDLPSSSDRPLYAIEETKTDDAESRNTGVYQRATKFVYLDLFYPGIEMTMLYNLQVSQKTMATDTNIFGTRCYRTLGIELSGKTSNDLSISPWKTIDELIDYKSSMRQAHKGNVPILIKKVDDDLITVSAKLIKNKSLSYDPNIGAVSLISATLRKLGWDKRIKITHHGLNKHIVKGANKFVQIANHLNIELDGISVPTAINPTEYWRYENTGEKIGTIFTHLTVEEFSNGCAIYENHAGCERGYFRTAEGKPLAVNKKLNDSKIAIPDLIIRDTTRLEIINVEGERCVNVLNGIKQLDTFQNIELAYVDKYYPDYKILRTIVLYGGTDETINHSEVSIFLNENGKIVLGAKAPKIFQDSINSLVEYWRTGRAV